MGVAPKNCLKGAKGFLVGLLENLLLFLGLSENLLLGLLVNLFFLGLPENLFLKGLGWVGGVEDSGLRPRLRFLEPEVSELKPWLTFLEPEGSGLKA